MKKGFDHLADGKRIDVILQCVLFVLMIFAVWKSGLGLFGLYVMGIGHILSSLVWVFILSGDTPKLASGNIIRTLCLSVAAILFLTLLIDDSAFLSLSCYMVIIGPILGLSYFIITIKEIAFYAKARKPYYLL